MFISCDTIIAGYFVTINRSYGDKNPVTRTREKSKPTRTFKIIILFHFQKYWLLQMLKDKSNGERTKRSMAKKRFQEKTIKGNELMMYPRENWKRPNHMDISG